MLAANQFVKSTNSLTDEVKEYPPAIVDMEATVSINGEFDKYAIDEWFTTLRKEQEEVVAEAVKAERERIIEDIAMVTIETVGNSAATVCQILNMLTPQNDMERAFHNYNEEMFQKLMDGTSPQNTKTDK